MRDKPSGRPGQDAMEETSPHRRAPLSGKNASRGKEASAVRKNYSMKAGFFGLVGSTLIPERSSRDARNGSKGALRKCTVQILFDSVA